MTTMNTLGSTGISDYQSRAVTINVTGVCQQSVLKTGSYQVRVPFSQMSQAMQTIHHQGGKVASVQLMASAPAESRPEAEAPNDENQGKNDENQGKKKTSRRKRG